MKDERTLMDFVKKLFSRKLLVFIVGTILLYFKMITQDIWILLAVSYMGLNTALAAIDTIKGAKATINSKKSALTQVPVEDGNVIIKEGEA